VLFPLMYTGVCRFSVQCQQWHDTNDYNSKAHNVQGQEHDTFHAGESVTCNICLCYWLL